jgi:hypothetical protein
LVSGILPVTLLPPGFVFVLRDLSTSTLIPLRSGDPGVGKSCLLSGFKPELVGVDTPFLIHLTIEIPVLTASHDFKDTDSHRPSSFVRDITSDSRTDRFQVHLTIVTVLETL